MFTACKTPKPLDVVPDFDVTKYTGTWHEIARLPNSFEKNLNRITATYSLMDNGKIKVENKGYLINNPSKQKSIVGKAYIPDSKVPAKIKVTFFWPFYGNYWVLAIDKDYQNALVGDPSRKYLWLLSRNDTMDNATYKTLENIALKKGFDVSKLIGGQ